MKRFITNIAITIAITVAILLPAIGNILANYFIKKAYFFQIIIYIYPLIVICIIAYKHGYSKNHAHFHGITKNIGETITFVKPLTFISSIAFGVISLLISFQINVFTEYDKHSENSPFYWFNSANILLFPVTQYSLNSEPKRFSINSVDKRNDSLPHIYIVDITKSTEPKSTDTMEYKGDTASLNTFLEDNIRSLLKCQDTCLVINYAQLSLQDKVSLYIIGNNNLIGSSDFAVFLYNGVGDTIVNINKSQTFYRAKSPLDAIIDTYFCCKHYGMDTGRQKSNFNTLVHSVDRTINNINSRNKVKPSGYYVHIISDFDEDDKKVKEIGSRAYYNNLKHLNRNKVKKISLIKFPTFVRTRNATCQKECSFCNANENIFVDACKKVCKNDIYYSEISVEHPDMDLSTIVPELGSEHKSESHFDSVDFYYSYKSNISKVSAASNLLLTNVTSDLNAFVKIACDEISPNEDVKYKIYKPDDPANYITEFVNNPIPLAELDSNVSNVVISITANSSFFDKKMHLYIGNSSSSNCNRYEIYFLPFLTKNESLYLIFFYSFFLLSISLLVFLTCLYRLVRGIRRLRRLGNRNNLWAKKRRKVLYYLIFYSLGCLVILCLISIVCSWYIYIISSIENIGSIIAVSYCLMLFILVSSVISQFRESIRR